MKTRLSWTAIASLGFVGAAIAVSWLSDTATDSVVALGLGSITMAVLSFRES